MRKRTVTHVADIIFWYALYFLPVILTIVQSFNLFQNFTFENWKLIGDAYNFTDFPFAYLFKGNLESLGFGFYPDNFIMGIFDQLFGVFGIFPLSLSSEIEVLFCYFCYFVSVYILHLCVDFILFIPRIAHKWMKKFTQGDE